MLSFTQSTGAETAAVGSYDVAGFAASGPNGDVPHKDAAAAFNGLANGGADDDPTVDLILQQVGITAAHFDPKNSQ
jgi:hypothetical protein